MAWACQGTEEHNPLTDMIFKIMSKMGFEVLDYDSEFPLILQDDTLDSYLSRINKDLWEIDYDPEVRLGDTLVFAYDSIQSGKLLKESGINVAPVINNNLVMPFMRGSKSSLHGFKKLPEVLLGGYSVICAIRPTAKIDYQELKV